STRTTSRFVRSPLSWGCIAPRSTGRLVVRRDNRGICDMASMNLHFLDARGALTGLVGWLRRCLTDTHEKAAGLMPLQPLHVVVQTGERIIPEKGHPGYAPKYGVVLLPVDPDNPARKDNADAA